MSDSKKIVTMAQVGTTFLTTIFSKNFTSELYFDLYFES